MTMIDWLPHHVELRYTYDSRVIRGTVLKFSDEYHHPSFIEQFDKNAFDDEQLQSREICINEGHTRDLISQNGNGLKLSRDDDGIEMVCELPDNPLCNRVYERIQDGLLKGLSVEFLRDGYNVIGNHITVTRARLTGIGIVNRPAYPQSVLRRKGNLIGLV